MVCCFSCYDLLCFLVGFIIKNIGILLHCALDKKFNLERKIMPTLPLQGVQYFSIVHWAFVCFLINCQLAKDDTIHFQIKKVIQGENMSNNRYSTHISFKFIYFDKM